MFFISYGTIRGLCGTRKGVVRQPYGHVREQKQSEFPKFPQGRRMWTYGPLTVFARAVHGLFTIFKSVPVPSAYNTCINTWVTSNHGSHTILAPIPFLARKAGWSAPRNFTPVLFSRSHQVTGPVRLDTTVHLLFAWSSISQDSI